MSNEPSSQNDKGIDLTVISEIMNPPRGDDRRKHTDRRKREIPVVVERAAARSGGTRASVAVRSIRPPASATTMTTRLPL